MDLKIFEGKFFCEKFVIMGYEFVGIVKEVGVDVKYVFVGDWWVLSWMYGYFNSFYFIRSKYGMYM